MASFAPVPVPKLVETLRQGYTLSAFVNDLTAGVTVGLVALPLAMAFAIASGVPPQNGLYCAVVAGFIISALGGSRTQIGGPTGAFVVVVAGIVTAYGLDGLFMCTLMAGVMLILLGVTGLGTAVNFIPHPVRRRHWRLPPWSASWCCERCRGGFPAASWRCCSVP